MTVKKSSSRFSVACALLSKMVKENRSFAGLALAKPNAIYKPPTTMSLLPGVDVSAENQPDTADTDPAPVRAATKCMDLFPSSEPEERPPLTIFYRGSVIVFDDLSETEAKDLVQMVSAAAASSSMADRLPGSCPTNSASLPPARVNHSADLLLQARNASVSRFLSKRKERTDANAPYQVRAKPAEA
ncbi:protein TIFY 10c-like isoform X1 [Iris pallida]|uniref:Protein TIFY n=1 Tax=Iris pallida TaxID=29817 RepID=A0AAX6GE48_IRIPA|nr:protein TIFY 10c-like isoform X1 [Iris pallida]